MKQYSIFYEENGNIYPMYEGKNGEWFLGGSKLYTPLFFTMKDAQNAVKQVKAKNHYPNTYKKVLPGRIFASRCEIKILTNT